MTELTSLAEPHHSEVERRNLETIARWGEYYNSDVDRMVRECYAPDCVIEVKGGISFQGHDTFAAIELGVERAAPRRRGALVRAIATGDTVIVQGMLTDPDRGPDWQSPYCAILTLRDGLIVRDESYLDLRVWPNPGLTREEWSTLNILAR
jgi:ketosteroid isomerase-like protein